MNDTPLAFTRPVSTTQIRTVMKTIPSWSKIEPKLTDDTQFTDTDMDSLALLELVAELQQLSGLEILDDDVEQISTITGITRYLNEKLG